MRGQGIIDRIGQVYWGGEWVGRAEEGVREGLTVKAL